ncbi:MAG: hypothetical protein Tsb0034_29010 [Ekhidna sp.]
MKSKLAHIVICLFLSTQALAQTQVEVITKTVKDQFVYQPGYGVEIEGKSAMISIQAWDKNEVGVEMKLISKGLTRAIAEKELKYQRYVIDEINETYVIRNYLLLPNGLEKLSTIQETEIRLFLPRQVAVSVKNSFGNTSAKGLTGKLEIESEYGDLSLQDLSGTLRIESTFGDLKIKNFTGSLTADLEHTATEIAEYAGNAYIKTNLGDMRWSKIRELTRLRINAEKSDISLDFLAPDPEAYYWSLRSKYGEIIFPGGTEEKNKITFGDDQNPPISITTDFGKITIEE